MLKNRKKHLIQNDNHEIILIIRMRSFNKKHYFYNLDRQPSSIDSRSRYRYNESKYIKKQEFNFHQSYFSKLIN